MLPQIRNVVELGSILIGTSATKRKNGFLLRLIFKENCMSEQNKRSALLQEVYCYNYVHLNASQTGWEIGG